MRTFVFFFLITLDILCMFSRLCRMKFHTLWRYINLIVAWITYSAKGKLSSYVRELRRTCLSCSDTISDINLSSAPLSCSSWAIRHRQSLTDIVSSIYFSLSLSLSLYCVTNQRTKQATIIIIVIIIIIMEMFWNCSAIIYIF